MKVAVIADDLTGAAELASAAADLGFTAEVHTRFDPTSDAQVIAVDTDSRTMSPEAGSRIVATITAEILRAKPEWIYKKTDSVLRGNVRAEIEAILEVAGLQSALYIPANPSKGRIIREGKYSVGGKPLHETSFANDPHHPRRSSDVLELLGKSARISMPDAEHPTHLQTHALGADEGTLAAGGVEFFRSVLERRIGLPTVVPMEPTQGGPVLFICGSPQACIDGRITQFKEQRVPVLPMPAAFTAKLAPTRDAIAKWSTEIIETFHTHKRAAVVIGELPKCEAPPASLAARLAETTADVLQRGVISTACIEGGATSGAVLTQLTLTRLTSLSTRSLPGVAAMQSAAHPGLTFLVKPGSYPWPDAVFNIGV